MRIIISSLILSLALSQSAFASTVIYEIYDFTQGNNGQLVTKGSREYSISDIEMKCDDVHCRKTLMLEQGYSIGASIYWEQELTGFGIWAKRNEQGFSWEWFNLVGNGKFDKLQESGMVTVSYKGLPVTEEIAEIYFDTDISLRLNESDEISAVTQKVLIKKGSILKFIP